MLWNPIDTPLNVSINTQLVISIDTPNYVWLSVLDSWVQGDSSIKNELVFVDICEIYLKQNKYKDAA